MERADFPTDPAPNNTIFISLDKLLTLVLFSKKRKMRKMWNTYIVMMV